MDQDQNQQPPTQPNQPNYDFIMKPGQENGQSSDPSAQPKKPGFHLSKPILFGGIVVVLILSVLTVTTLIASKNKNSSNSGAVAVIVNFFKAVESEEYTTANSLIMPEANPLLDASDNFFYKGIKNLLDFDKCKIVKTDINSIATTINFDCDAADQKKYELITEVIEKDSVQVISLFTLKEVKDD